MAQDRVVVRKKKDGEMGRWEDGKMEK